MASTIITKHGSASNAPSSLTQGELAINVTTGKLYYGSGSQTATSVVEDFTFGHITSSGIWVSGSNDRKRIHLDGEGNISASGDITLRHITASGNISASGNIVTSGFISSSGRIQTLSHITASGNISSSGKITTNNFQFSGAIRALDSGGTSRHIIKASSGNEIEIGNTFFANGIRLTGNVTASGTITCSGSIIHGNVSASGNIVTSGFISSSGRLQTLSHITASGNISASGHISCSGIIIPEKSGLVAHYNVIGYATGDGTNFEFAKNMATNTAPFNHDISFGSDGLTAQTTQTLIRMGGIVMPRACTLTKWTGWSTCQGNGTSNIGLFKVTPTRADSSTVSAVLLHDYEYTALGNATMEDFDLTSFTVSSIAAGDMIMSGLKSVSGQIQFLTSTFEVEFD